MEIPASKLTDQPLPDARCYVISGPEDTGKHEMVERIRQLAVGDGSGFDEEMFEGKNCTADQIIGAVQTIPFDSPKRLVVVRGANKLQQADAEKIAQLIGEPAGEKKKSAKSKAQPSEQLAESACLVLLCFAEQGSESDSGRKSNIVLKLLEDAAKKYAALISFPEVKGDEAAKRIRETSKAFGKNISMENARYLLSLVDGQYGLAAAEFDKVLHYVGSLNEITQFDLDKVVTPSKQSRIFSFVDAIAEGKLSEALNHLQLLLGGTERPEAVAIRTIIPLLGRHFRLLWQMKASGGKLRQNETAKWVMEEPSLVKLLERQPYLESRFKRQAARFNMAQLSEVFELLYETDRALKGAAPSLNASDTLERLVAGACRLSSSQEQSRAY